MYIVYPHQSPWGMDIKGFKVKDDFVYSSDKNAMLSVKQLNNLVGAYDFDTIQ